MPGNSFSHERSTYGCNCAITQTSAALYSFGVISRSIPRLISENPSTVRTALEPARYEREGVRRERGEPFEPLAPRALPEFLAACRLACAFDAVRSPFTFSARLRTCSRIGVP